MSDRRTIRIQELKFKLESARDFIRQSVDHAVDVYASGNQVDRSWLIKQGVRRLESTKD